MSRGRRLSYAVVAVTLAVLFLPVAEPALRARRSGPPDVSHRQEAGLSELGHLQVGSPTRAGTRGRSRSASIEPGRDLGEAFEASAHSLRRRSSELVKGQSVTGLAGGGSHARHSDTGHLDLRTCDHKGTVVINFNAPGAGSLCLNFTAKYGKSSAPSPTTSILLRHVRHQPEARETSRGRASRAGSTRGRSPGARSSRFSATDRWCRSPPEPRLRRAAPAPPSQSSPGTESCRAPRPPRPRPCSRSRSSSWRRQVAPAPPARRPPQRLRARCSSPATTSAELASLAAIEQGRRPGHREGRVRRQVLHLVEHRWEPRDRVRHPPDRIPPAARARTRQACPAVRWSSASSCQGASKRAVLDTHPYANTHRYQKDTSSPRIRRATSRSAWTTPTSLPRFQASLP